MDQARQLGITVIQLPWQISNINTKMQYLIFFRFFTKVFIFVQNFDFSSKVRFWPKIKGFSSCANFGITVIQLPWQIPNISTKMQSLIFFFKKFSSFV